jgi:hypothetical protein
MQWSQIESTISDFANNPPRLANMRPPCSHAGQLINRRN